MEGSNYLREAVRPERGRDGRFAKGLTPHNKGVKGFKGKTPESIAKHEETIFKKGRLPKQTLPKGTIVKRIRRGARAFKKGVEEYVEMLMINIDWKGNRKTNNPYHWYVWEVANNRDRPEGYVLVHLDGDPENNSLKNLQLMTRKEMIVYTRKLK